MSSNSNNNRPCEMEWITAPGFTGANDAESFAAGSIAVNTRNFLTVVNNVVFGAAEGKFPGFTTDHLLALIGKAQDVTNQANDAIAVLIEASWAPEYPDPDTDEDDEDEDDEDYVEDDEDNDGDYEDDGDYDDEDGDDDECEVPSVPAKPNVESAVEFPPLNPQKTCCIPSNGKCTFCVGPVQN